MNHSQRERGRTEDEQDILAILEFGYARGPWVYSERLNALVYSSEIRG